MTLTGITLSTEPANESIVVTPVDKVDLEPLGKATVSGFTVLRNHNIEKASDTNIDRLL